MPWASSNRITSVHASPLASTKRGQKSDDDGVVRAALPCMFNTLVFWLHRSVATDVLHPLPRAERLCNMATSSVKRSKDRGAAERK